MSSDYSRVEKAITYLVEHAAGQPSLEELAAHVGLSPYHFQRMFCRWAGTTPKRFLQQLTLERGKALLERSASLLNTSYEIGLSGSSRLHDHFVKLEAVTPGEYKSRGRGVPIVYGAHSTPFGELFVAKTERGVCCAGFTEFSSAEELLAQIQTRWPLAEYRWDTSATQTVVETMFNDSRNYANGPLSLHIAGTNFQMAVWKALLNIPPGVVTSYSQLASKLGRPAASRAVGNAVGANPVALLIPCHRVIQQSGAIGGYRWGVQRKQVIQAWEQFRVAE